MTFVLSCESDYHNKRKDSKNDYEEAMRFLKQRPPESSLSLYEHLSSIVYNALEERPENIVDDFEEFSRAVKSRGSGGRVSVHERDSQKSQYDENAILHLKRIQRLFAQNSCYGGKCQEGIGSADDGQVDLLATLDNLRRAGVGLPQEEGFNIALAVNTLVTSRPIIKVRLWGKVLGTERDYIVVEAELTDHELDRRIDKMDSAQQELAEDLLNRKLFLVTNEPGDAWEELPSISPEHVVAAREQRRFFTGNLHAQVRMEFLHTHITVYDVYGESDTMNRRPNISYPGISYAIAVISGYPGSEGHLLHAQIVRISATCLISPSGVYYKTPSDTSDLYEDEYGVLLNKDWTGVPLPRLANMSLTSWVHHVPPILPNGCVAELPEEDGEEEEELEEEEEEEEEIDYLDKSYLEEDSSDRTHRKQSGDNERRQEADVAPLLTPLSEDDAVDGQLAWTPRLTSTCLPHVLTVLMRSAVWPGAVAYCFRKQYGCLYIGWGLKTCTGKSKSSRDV